MGHFEPRWGMYDVGLLCLTNWCVRFNLLEFIHLQRHHKILLSFNEKSQFNISTVWFAWGTKHVFDQWTYVLTQTLPAQTWPIHACKALRHCLVWIFSLSIIYVANSSVYIPELFSHLRDKIVASLFFGLSSCPHCLHAACTVNMFYAHSTERIIKRLLGRRLACFIRSSYAWAWVSTFWLSAPTTIECPSNSPSIAARSRYVHERQFDNDVIIIPRSPAPRSQTVCIACAGRLLDYPRVAAIR